MKVFAWNKVLIKDNYTFCRLDMNRKASSQRGLISKEGRITIPKEERTKHNLPTGTFYEITEITDVDQKTTKMTIVFFKM